MQCEAERAVSIFSGVEDQVNLGRRWVLGGMMAMAAAATSPAIATAAGLCPHDETMLYLYRRFELAANGINGSCGEEGRQCHRQMLSYANAMVVVPARNERAIESKRLAAAWSFVDGSIATRLPAQLVSELLASADRDAQQLLQ